MNERIYEAMEKRAIIGAIFRLIELSLLTAILVKLY
jgi:hypothetical protein